MQIPSPKAPVGKSLWTRSAQVAGVVVLNAGLLWVVLWTWGKPFTSLQTAPDLTIDLNHADAATLMQVPGIGPNLAKRIVEHRPYKSVAELQNVPGIGPILFEAVHTFFHVGPVPLKASPTSVKESAKIILVKTTATLDKPINVNTASAAELDQLPGIGKTLAERIVEERSKQPFTSIDDLDRVPGIGKKTIAKLRPFATVDEAKKPVRID